MKVRLILISALATSVAFGFALGCGSSDDDSTGGNGGGNNGGGNNGGGNNMPQLPILSTGSLQNPTENDADFSCLNMRAAPTSTAALVPFRLEIKDFEDDFTTEGLRVQVFADNIIDIAACNAPNCTESMTDANGFAAVMGRPGAWFAYRVFEKPGATAQETVKGSVQFNTVAPARDGATDGTSISQQTLDLIPTVLGFNRAPMTGLIAGSFEDCTGTSVYGAIARLRDANGNIIEEGMRQSDPHYRYFDGDDFPSAQQPFTHRDGLFAVANLPIDANGSTRVTVEMLGRLDGDTEPRVLGREEVVLFPDTITIINPTPLRSN